MTRALLLTVLLAPLGGCFWIVPCGGDTDCPDPGQVQRGQFPIEDADPEAWIGGELDIREDQVLLSWTDDAGNRFQAIYDIVEETGEPLEER